MHSRYKNLTEDKVKRLRKLHYAFGEGSGGTWLTDFVQKCAIGLIQTGFPAESITDGMLESWGDLWWRIDQKFVVNSEYTPPQPEKEE